jgi:hypothetical protein
VPLYDLHLEREVALQRCRHPGGVPPGDSVAALADGDSHRGLLRLVTTPAGVAVGSGARRDTTGAALVE